jgi:hypothetical protein
MYAALGKFIAGNQTTVAGKEYMELKPSKTDDIDAHGGQATKPAVIVHVLVEQKHKQIIVATMYGLYSDPAS